MHVLPAMTTRKPRAKTAATASFCLSFICSFRTIVMGKLIAAQRQFNATIGVLDRQDSEVFLTSDISSDIYFKSVSNCKP